jgi:oligosaccharyltransferase complex subunit beta
MSYSSHPQQNVRLSPYSQYTVVSNSTKSAFAKDITPQNILTLLSQDVNILFALSSTTHTPLTSLAAEFGLIYPPPGTGLISHFPPGREEKDIVEIDISSSPLSSPSKAKGKKILYKGASHAYSSPPPHSLFKILSAPIESFSIDSDSSSTDKSHMMIVDGYEKGGEGLWAGSGMGIVSGFVANGGARVAFTGGVEMFGEEFVNGKSVE